MCLLDQPMDENTTIAATYISPAKKTPTLLKIKKHILETPSHNPIQRRLSRHCFGKEYFVTSVKQEILTSLTRAQQMQNSKKFKVRKKWGTILNFVEKFKKLFVNSRVEINDLQETLAQKLSEVYQKYVEKGSIVTMNIKDQPVSWHIKEHLKQINKIKTDKSSRQAYKDKAGQSVKAWEKDFNGAFCAFFRLLEERLLANLKPNIIYANGKSDIELKNIFDKYKGLWQKVFNLDLTEYDGSQNACTMEIEQRLWSYFLGCDLTIKNYYMIRTQMKVFGTGYSYTKVNLKDSGAPETLPSNTLLLMALTSVLFNVDDIIFATFKGDDAAVALKPNANTTFKYSELNKISNFSPKQLITENWFEFCGNIYFEEEWFYDFVKLGRKVLNRGFTSRNDLEDYQNSIIDKLRQYINSSSKIDKILSEIYGCNEATINSIVTQLGAFSFTKWEHIDKLLQNVEFTETQFASVPRKITSREQYSKVADSLWDKMQRKISMSEATFGAA